MNLDVVLLDEAGLDEELRGVLALIALQLNYLAELLVVNHIAVATELLLEILEDLLVAEVLLQPLDRCQALLPVPLLDADVHILLGPGGIRILDVGEGVECGWDLEVDVNHVL